MFAAAAVHTTIQMNKYNVNAYQAAVAADYAYLVADAMMKRRKNPAVKAEGGGDVNPM